MTNEGLGCILLLLTFWIGLLWRPIRKPLKRAAKSRARREKQRALDRRRYERWLLDASDLTKEQRIEYYELVARRIGKALYRNRTRRATMRATLAGWWDVWWFKLKDDGTISWKGTDSAFGPYNVPFNGKLTAEAVLVLDPDMPPGTARLYARLLNRIHAEYLIASREGRRA